MGYPSWLAAAPRLFCHFVAELARDIGAVAAIEFAIVVPALLLMMLCTVDLGIGIYRKMQVQNAVQAGADYVIVNGVNSTSSAIATAVTNATSFSGVVASPAPNQFCGCPSTTGVTSISCNSTCSGGAAPGSYWTVSAQGTYNTLLSYPLLPNSFLLAAQATVRFQ